MKPKPTITVKEFLEETGIDRGIFREACDLKLIPFVDEERDLIDFCGGWWKLNQYIESGPHGSPNRRNPGVRREILREISGSDRVDPPTNRGSRISSDYDGSGAFFSEAGRRAFEKAAAAGSIHIKGQRVVSSGSSLTWWEEEGFGSEEGARAFERAKKNGGIRIFEGKGVVKYERS
jgi:hypothetical protein